MTGQNLDLGFLFLGTTTTKFVTSIADGTTKVDTFKFSTGSSTANVAISTSGVTNSPFSLALFRDLNNNGTLDSSELVISNRIRLSDSGSGRNEANESLNANLTQGTYFAQTKSFLGSSFFYRLDARRANPGSANPLANQEIQVGQISADLQKRGRISDTNTADNFAFTLDGSSSLNIDVSELGKKKGDVNIRIVQDRDGDGTVDKNEVVVLGTSSSQGNIDTITGLKGAGDYILQVCQTQGKTKFAVNFDHSAV